MKDDSKAITALVRDFVFRRQEHGETLESEFPEIFVYSNEKLQETPEDFLRNHVILLGGFRPHLFLINKDCLRNYGLHIDYSEDDLLRSIQPHLFRNEGTIRNKYGQFDKNIPTSCYEVISCNKGEIEPASTKESYSHFEDLFMKKITGFADNYYLTRQ